MIPRRRQAALLEDALFQVKRVIVGQDRMIERTFICLLARGHCLIEGVPGLAKTLMVSTLARVVGGDFSRIQFTPDLVPADIIGTRIWRPSQEEFAIEWGPVFANIVLADEINRAPAKVQAALLEVMAEGHVSIGGSVRAVAEPFLVLATQNPIESEGVYSLPEAQRDRFLMQVVVEHPSYVEEMEIARRMLAGRPEVEQVLSLEQLGALQRAVEEVFVHHAVADYAVRLVMATRDPERWGVPELASQIELGASPRATLGLLSAGRAMALLRGRRFVVPGDVHDVAPEVLRHRVLLSYDALAEGTGVEDVVRRVLEQVPEPRIAPQQDEAARTAPAASFAAPPATVPRPPHAAGKPTGWVAPWRSRQGSRLRPPRAGRSAAAHGSGVSEPTLPPSAPPAAVAAKAAVLRRLELEVTRRLDGMLTGDYLAVAAGPGTEPAGARPYEPGDDARRMDWNLTARAARPPCAHDRRRPGDGDLDRRRPLRQPRLRYRGMRKTRPGAGRIGRVRVPHRPARQPARNPGRRRGERHPGPGPQRSGARSWPRWPPSTTRRGPTGSPVPAPIWPARLGRLDRSKHQRGQVVVISDFLDPSGLAGRRSPAWRSATRSWPCTSPIPASSSCRPSACSG